MASIETEADLNTFSSRFFLQEELPSGTLVHFEDFGRANAQQLLDTYKDSCEQLFQLKSSELGSFSLAFLDRIASVPAFNDDVQGTGAVTLAALQSALHVAESSVRL
jgi:hypothetical protein